MNKSIPIIDLFAGPGGLGEGFSSLKQSSGEPVFSIKVSIEKDPVAHRTLSLRAIYRQFGKEQIPESYYDYIKGNMDRADFEKKPEIREAAKLAHIEANCAILGETPNELIDQWIDQGLQKETEWVLIGGPPCQAYSLAGRSRMKGKGADPCAFESDHRHLLYKEYLRIITKFKPAIFVMENVKGILSSTLDGSLIFERIMSDLSSLGSDTEYDLKSFVVDKETGKSVLPKDFIITSENYGIPQARHRVILLGIRKGLTISAFKKIPQKPRSTNVLQTIAGLPKIRSRISREKDSFTKWLDTLKQATTSLQCWPHDKAEEIAGVMKNAVIEASHHESCGAVFIPGAPDFSGMPAELKEWLEDERLGGVIQHESRSHMRSDLKRYLFAASYAKVMQISPKLKQFPGSLLPEHRNVHDKDVPFVDRFRVQVDHMPSTTIVSHIAKDGHYYIHYDPSQCRSLTVREAARLQTFPDNYFFEGNRTQQYVQVGNAVPPLLAKQLAEIVAGLLGRSFL